MLHRFLVWELTVLACAGAGGVEPPAVYGVQIPAERRFGRGGILLRDGVPGTPEGHAIADMNYWLSTGDCDLADASFRLEHQAIGAPSATFVHAWALLRLAVQKRRGFARALEEFERVETEDLQLRGLLQALVRSVRRTVCTACSAGSVACGSCGGASPSPPCMDDICRVDRCVACQGLGLRARNLRIPCPQCFGVGWRLTPKVDPN
jgi:hypothetical protein